MDQTVRKALTLSETIVDLWRKGALTASQARNHLDRLALRMESEAPAVIEDISALYMKIAA